MGEFASIDIPAMSALVSAVGAAADALDHAWYTLSVELDTVHLDSKLADPLGSACAWLRIQQPDLQNRLKLAKAADTPPPTHHGGGIGGWLTGAVDTVGSVIGDIPGGVERGVVKIVDGVQSLTPLQSGGFTAAEHAWDGLLDGFVGFAQQEQAMKSEPPAAQEQQARQFVKNQLDGPDWKHHPGRAIGEIATNFIPGGAIAKFLHTGIGAEKVAAAGLTSAEQATVMRALVEERGGKPLYEYSPYDTLEGRLLWEYKALSPDGWFVKLPQPFSDLPSAEQAGLLEKLARRGIKVPSVEDFPLVTHVDGHSGAWVIPGKIRGGLIVNGHGAYITGSGIAVVPKDATVTFYTRHGAPISVGEAAGIITFGLGRFFRHKTTYFPGEHYPNYTLFPPTDIVTKNDITVPRATPVVDLVEPGNNYHWLGCMSGGAHCNVVIDMKARGLTERDFGRREIVGLEHYFGPDKGFFSNLVGQTRARGGFGRSGKLALQPNGELEWRYRTGGTHQEFLSAYPVVKLWTPPEQ